MKKRLLQFEYYNQAKKDAYTRNNDHLKAHKYFGILSKLLIVFIWQATRKGDITFLAISLCRGLI